MGWSPLSTETWNTSQYSARTRSPAGVVLHHGATTSADAIISMEVSGSRQVSSHQVVKDKRNAGIVQEQFRAWSLSDAYWDSWAFTVECANESTNGWTISAASQETLAQLVADWAKRYGFYPHRDGDDRYWTVYGHREIYTIFGGSYATACPGGMDLDWITKRAQQILAGDSGMEDDDMASIYFIINDDLAKAKLGIGNGSTVARLGVGQPLMYLTPGQAEDSLKADRLVSAAGYTEASRDRVFYRSGSWLLAAVEEDNATRVVNVKIHPWMASSGSGGSTDLTPVLDAIAKVPTAAQNGSAARDAIVK